MGSSETMQQEGFNLEQWEPILNSTVKNAATFANTKDTFLMYISWEGGATNFIVSYDLNKKVYPATLGTMGCNSAI